tara:strand:+ start:90 stop:482 length:393 start_codon:yes stop_codon:yes gene_type:complete
MRRKISEIMGGYLQETDRAKFDFLPPLEEGHTEYYDKVPVKPSVSEWVVSTCGKKLQQEFTFPNIRSRNAFVLDIMELEKTMGHHMDFDVSGSKVFVSLQTKDLGVITDLDVECSKHLSDCAVDIRQSRL